MSFNSTLDKLAQNDEFLKDLEELFSNNGEYLDESLSDDIRKNNLDYDDEIDAWYKKDDDTEIQFQDRETHYHDMKSKSPRTSSHTWGRVWKGNKLDKQFDGPKYKVRQDMARYLDSGLNESTDTISSKIKKTSTRVK